MQAVGIQLMHFMFKGQTWTKILAVLIIQPVILRNMPYLSKPQFLQL